jgi:hypothetical protein
LLLNRRTPYQLGSGHHELWLSMGARAGHGGLYGVDAAVGDPGTDARGERQDG